MLYTIRQPYFSRTTVARGDCPTVQTGTKTMSAGIFSSSCFNLLQQPALCHSWVCFSLRGILKTTTDTKQEEEERSRGPEVSTAGFRGVEKGLRQSTDVV